MNPLRLSLAVALGLATAILVLPPAWALGHSGAAAIAMTAVASGLVILLLLRRGLAWLEPAAVTPALAVVSALAAAGALLAFARLAVFIVDPSQTGYSSVPRSDWELHHSCASAYFVAARASTSTTDIYADSLYNARDDDPRQKRKPLMLGTFRIDVFEYPPPFLLLPRAVRLLAPEFLPFRMLWFGLNGAFVLLAMVVCARSLGPRAGTRALLLLPLVWCSLPMLSNAQKGNVHASVIATGMLAMCLFARKRRAIGGAFLAFAIVSKLYPGLLLVYLLARREWRAAAWTSVFAAAFAVLALTEMGRGVYAAFAHHLPGLMSGEAFPAFRNPSAVAINYSIPGLVFKLKLFGVAGLGFTTAKLVGWTYTLVAVVTTLALARREPREGERPILWLTVITLATLRSPFLPQSYAAIPALWLLTLLAARLEPTARTLALTLLAWAMLGIMWPLDRPMDPRSLALLSGIPQLLTIALPVVVVSRHLRAGAAPA